MAEVFAGFVSGYLVALIFTALAAIMIVQVRSRIPYLAKAIAPNISAAALAVPISLVAFLLWTAIGMILGLLYRGAEDQAPAGGLGSPNLLFTLVIAITGAFILTLVLALWRRLPWQVAVMSLTFVAVFGWAMPYLAQAAK